MGDDPLPKMVGFSNTSTTTLSTSTQHSASTSTTTNISYLSDHGNHNNATTATTPIDLPVMEQSLNWESQAVHRKTEIDNTMRSVNTFFQDIYKLQQPLECSSKTSSSNKNSDHSTPPVVVAENVNLKRKNSECSITLKEDVSKRRKLINRLSRFSFIPPSNVTFSQKWASLLSPIVEKKPSSDSGPSGPTSSTATGIATLLPTQNSLLMKYDPIKILNRPGLFSKLRNSTETYTNSNNTATGNLFQKTTISSLPGPSVQLNTSTSTALHSSQNSEGKRNESDIMPPPKFPPYWSQGNKSNIDCSSSPKVQINSSGITQGALVSPRTRRDTLCNSNQYRRMPYHVPKVNVAVSEGRETKIACYDNIGLKISYTDFRLSTIAIARKILRKHRRYSLNRRRLCSKVGLSSSSQIASKGKNNKVSENVAKTSRTLSGVKSIFKLPSKVETKHTNTACSLHTDITTSIPENPFVQHTIELLRHKRELQKRLELIEEEGIVCRLIPMPKLLNPKPKGQLTHHNIPLTEHQTKELLHKRLSVMLAHGGFTHTNQQPLEVLSDVMEDFFVGLTRRLKQVREMEMHGVEQEFPDPLERVLVEMGIGGVRGTQKYYQNQVVDYRKRIEDHCISLRKLYAHKIRLKVGMVTHVSGGVNSSSSSTTTSSQPISPGNSAIVEILSGLEDPMASSLHFEEDEKLKSHFPHYPSIVRNDSIRQIQPHHNPVQKSSQMHFNSSNHQQNQSLHPQSHQLREATQNVQQILQSAKQIRLPQSTPQCSQNMKISSPTSNPTAVYSNVAKASQQVNFPNNMVSINLNNNVDLGGFVPITSPGSSRTPTTVNINKGVITCGASSSSNDPKAKLKEALSQRNLLRLNFEQVPSSCDSTVLLSSSSPSLSSSSGSSNKTPTSSSSISQTARLKL